MTTYLDWISSLLGVFGLLFGIVGVVIGYKQTRSMRKQTELYKEKCSIRYKDVSNTVSNLTEHIIGACEIVKSECIGQSRQCSILSANISSAMSLSREMIRFCKRLDEEYETEFHNPIDENVAKHLDDIDCRCIDMPGFSHPRSFQESAQNISVLPGNA
jgi:hypothetical protein